MIGALAPHDLDRLRANTARVRERIAAACARAGRSPDDVTLVAVTKYAPLAAAASLPALGVADLGENRVQQLVERAAAAPGEPAGWPGQCSPEPAEAAAGAPPPRWHMIGHLQRNKVRALLAASRIIHSLDSPRLAAALHEEAARIEAVVDAFVEVNVAGEASKGGAAPADLDALFDALRPLHRVRLRGLMTMAPLSAEGEAARPFFAALRAQLERLRRTGRAPAACVHLSMGMSQDYSVAVEEGATVIRVGSALFEGLSTTDPRGRP